MKLIVRKLMYIAIAMLFALTCSFVSAAPLPVEAFGKLPEARQVTLSPDGNKFAFLRNIKGSIYIGVTDLLKNKTKYIVKTDNEKFKIARYIWANNDTILISANYPVRQRTFKYSESRLLKINVNDSNAVATSVIKYHKKDHVSQFQTNIIDMLPDDPDHILMVLDLKTPNQPDVYKINLHSSKKRSLVYRGKSYINDWMTDRQHRVRLGFGRDETKIFFRLLDLKSEKWRNIWEYEIFDAPDITPLGFGLDPNQLYIRALHKARYAIFKVDVSKHELTKELVYADANYDIEGSLIYSKKSGEVIGVYHGEADDAKVFFAPEYANFQQSLNKAIPDAFNNIISMSADERKYILFTSSDQVPGAYYLGNRDDTSLSFVLEQYPLLYQHKLGSKSKVSYKARDGVMLEAYVTLPDAGIKKNNPAIVLPHGGPMARTYGGFDWFTAFFANRGYTIIEPNFRGSSGYGFEFEMASIGKWGGKMQDDLADTANWLVENYSIDKNKICILGGSYGGYAALMAAVKQQATFRCAASFAGVADLEFIVRKSYRFTNSDVVKKQFGNKDLDEKSPINFAKQINIPVMLIHGSEDRVVDVAHSRNMYDELQDHDKDVEYVELANGNHHMSIEANRLKVLTSFEKFLAKHLQ